MIDVDKAIAAAVKTGKVVFGVNEAIRSTKAGKARLIVVSSNNASQIREDLGYYGQLSQIPIVSYRGNSIDLGIVCGKRFAIATLTVKEPGDSDILELAQKTKTKQEFAKETIEEL